MVVVVVVGSSSRALRRTRRRCVGFCSHICITPVKLLVFRLSSLMFPGGTCLEQIGPACPHSQSCGGEVCRSGGPNGAMVVCLSGWQKPNGHAVTMDENVVAYLCAVLCQTASQRPLIFQRCKLSRQLSFHIDDLTHSPQLDSRGQQRVPQCADRVLTLSRSLGLHEINHGIDQWRISGLSVKLCCDFVVYSVPYRLMQATEVLLADNPKGPT